MRSEESHKRDSPIHTSLEGRGNASIACGDTYIHIHCCYSDNGGETLSITINNNYNNNNNSNGNGNGDG